MVLKRCCQALPISTRYAQFVLNNPASGQAVIGTNAMQNPLPASDDGTEQANNLLRRLEELNAIGIALSSERDISRLLETILVAAKRITNADAGTLYLMEPDQQLLRFEIMRTETLGIAMGGTTGNAIPFYPIHLIGKDGKPNNSMVVAHVVLNDVTVNIAD